MRILIIFFLAFTFQGKVQANEYATSAIEYCKSKEGKKVGTGGCNSLVYGLLKRTNTIGYYKGLYNDSSKIIEAGDYLFFNKLVFSDKSRIGAHFVVVVGVDGDKITVAEQGSRMPKVAIRTMDFSMITSGDVEVYGLKDTKEKVSFTPRKTVKKYKNGKLVKNKTRGNFFDIRCK